MSRRKKLTRRQYTAIYDQAGGVCCLCKTPIDAAGGGKWIAEHIKPLWLGGADDNTNMGPAHLRCAVEKTKGEVPVKAKSDRVRANYLGVRKRAKGRPLPGTRASGIRKRMSGAVERWPT